MVGCEKSKHRLGSHFKTIPKLACCLTICMKALKDARDKPVLILLEEVR